MNITSTLERIAFLDDLTGLKNKSAFLEDFKDQSLDGWHFIYVDIDDFKKMNTVFGIDEVDKILIMVSNTLKDYCGKSEVYRIGAGQFLLGTDSHLMCEPTELQRLLIQPIELDDHLQLVVNASICVIDHDDFEDMELIPMLKLIQLNLEIAKKKGRNQLVYADNATRQLYLEKKNIADNLYKGVKEKEFYPKFQPFVDTFTNEIIGFEAVSRWNLDGEMLRPGCFLEAAEWTGLIFDIEMQMFEEAVKFFSELQENKDIKLSKRFKAAVHFSRYTLKRVDIYELLMVLKRYNIHQKDIIIETHERYISDQKAYAKIKELRSHRFMVLLDDYSNSNASLTYLADLKIDTIKLSESLLDKIDSDEEYMRMMNVYKFMVEISKNFNITVISDGINSSANAKLVRELDVHIGLGKYYSRAIVKEDFIEFMKSNKKKR